jgi:hypothetical protein
MTSSRQARAGLVLAAGALFAALALALGRPGGPVGDGGGIHAAPLDGRSPRPPSSERVRVLVELGRPPLGARGGPGESEPARQRAYVRSLRRESRALQGALRARGVELGDPVSYARVWNGFAATVRPDDLPELETLGARAEPVRRFYPATDSARAQPAPDSGARADVSSPSGPPALALLDSGVDVSHPGLSGRVVRGYDAVARREAGAGQRSGVREEHGTELAGVLVRSVEPRERVLAIRVAGRSGSSATAGARELGTTDALLGGLERAVDPDGNGDTDDGVRVAVVGVSAPFAGFARAPEAEAVAAAGRLGTLVVAPAGNDGPGVGAFGTLGSPGAAPGAIAAGALSRPAEPGLPRVQLGLAGRDGRALLAGTLLGGDRPRALRARTTGLSGPSQASVRRRGRALGLDVLEYFGVDATPRARGAVVVVPSRGGRAPAPAAAVRVSAAAAAGAAVLVLCEPDGRRPVHALPRGAAGGTLVVSLTGPAARRALELTRVDGATAFLSAPEPRRTSSRPGPASTSSRGPTYMLRPKPELAGPGTALAPRPVQGWSLVSGTSVAAARVGASALNLHRRLPGAPPAELTGRLVGTARPHGGELSAAGAGTPAVDHAAAASVWAEPPLMTLRRGRTAGEPARGRVVLRGPGAATPGLRPVVRADQPGVRASAVVARAESVIVELRGDRALRGAVTGHVRLGGIEPPVTVPFLLPAPAPHPRLGPLRLTGGGGRRGVRFVVGAARRGPGGMRVEPVGSLELVLQRADGTRVRELTPAGGSSDLLPGEYAFALSREDLAALAPGSYRFFARAVGPAGGSAVTSRSLAFRTR